MKYDINLDEVQPVVGNTQFQWNLRLTEFNGKCRIIYSTTSPQLCSGTINLVSTDGPQIVAATEADPYGGHFDTGKPFGSGYYVQWNVLDANSKCAIICWTGITGQS